MTPWFPFWSSCLEFDSHIHVQYLFDNKPRSPGKKIFFPARNFYIRSYFGHLHYLPKLQFWGILANLPFKSNAGQKFRLFCPKILPGKENYIFRPKSQIRPEISVRYQQKLYKKHDVCKCLEHTLGYFFF